MIHPAVARRLLGAQIGLRIPDYIPSGPQVRMRGAPEQVSEAIDLILKSERPVIIAGGGVMLSRAQAELIRFAELIGIPVMTTPCGRGAIPEDHPLAIGAGLVDSCALRP